jgi:hypothetical protein
VPFAERRKRPGGLDFLVNDGLVVELKSLDRILPIHKAQALTYLRLTRFPQAADQLQRIGAEARNYQRAA